MSITVLAGLMMVAIPPAADHTAINLADFCAERTIGWSGTIDDRRRVNAAPVPEKFKALWKRARHSCESFDKESFLDWHLKFGTEQSTLAALAWIDATYRNDVNAIIPAAFIEDWKVSCHKGGGCQAAKINSEQLASYEFLAQEYLRAAEFFHSPALLAKARPYVEAVNINLHIFYKDGPIFLRIKPQSGYTNSPEDQLKALRDFNLRYFVETAYQTGSKNDINAAQKLLDSIPDGPEMMVLAASLVNSANGDPCESDGGEFKADAVAKACKSEDDLGVRVTQYWRERAMLDEVRARTTTREVYASVGNGKTSLDIALLFLRRLLPTGNQSIRGMDSIAASEIVGLYLAAAKTERLCAQRLRLNISDDCNNSGDDYLSFAEELISPVTNPNRIRQIAAAYEEICQEPEIDEVAPCHAGSELGRQAAFMHIVASHIDELDGDGWRTSQAFTSTAKPTGQ